MADIIAYPLKPDGTADTSGIVVLEYSGDIADGGYYTTRHFRVPMKISGSNKQVAMFFKTIASQVIETGVNGSTDGKRFVTPFQKDVLSKLSIVEGGGSDSTKHIKITDGGNEYIVPSSHDITVLQTHIGILEGNQDTFDNSLADHDGRIKTLEDYFDGAIDADNIINKWHEIEDFLSGITESDTLTDLISSAISNLKSGNNTWTGNNTWKGTAAVNEFQTDLKVANLLTPGYVHISQSNENMKYEMKQILYSNDATGTSTTLNIPISLSNTITGTIALTKEIPYIGFTAPTNPKAGDFWLSA